MGQPKAPKPVKLVMSLILASRPLWPSVMEDLGTSYGETDFVSPWLAFDFTDYYASEMGNTLERRFISFRRLIEADSLPDTKHETNRIEQRYGREGKRQVNIDPGYIAGEHMILATTKAYSHRPYLRDGIYADLTLIYRTGSFRPLEWTYPDYRQSEVIEMFNRIRKTYLSQLRKMARVDPEP